ncbi:hypothetical protein HMPREF2678_08050 [Corynebacterium sp. HMSC058E07]|nr:hypothetical protein HMPREF2678_08050 [Corynebacterium sp. HMSC058E07]
MSIWRAFPYKRIGFILRNKLENSVKEEPIRGEAMLRDDSVDFRSFDYFKTKFMFSFQSSMRFVEGLMLNSEPLRSLIWAC